MHSPRRSPQRQAGFIILFGWRTIVSRDGREPVETTCPQCRRQTRMHPKKSRNWFTLFFIPVLPLSAAKPISQCEACGVQLIVDIEAFRKTPGASTAGGWQRAIELFNLMRETPEDPVRLHEMMSAYCDLGEFREAVSSAKVFPKALAASDTCMMLMAHAYAKIGDQAQARDWCEQVLAKNPGSAAARDLRKQIAAAAG